MQKITIYNSEKNINISEKKNMADEFERAAINNSRIDMPLVELKK